MLTLNAILKEMKGIPVDRLEDLYSFVHSLNTKINKSDNLRKTILAFAGSFNDMTDKDYSDFVKETKKVRAKLFERNINL
ncbi:MAG: hypothetical protein NTV87_15595 [Ignavibacteriae bacterium]|jgi:hypothetical protein|nr:hypothetical protein [Ignavibacteriota bacterium]